MPPEIMITASAARTVSVLRIHPMPVVSAMSTYGFASRFSKPGRMPTTSPPADLAPRLTASITPERPPLTTTAPRSASRRPTSSAAASARGGTASFASRALLPMTVMRSGRTGLRGKLSLEDRDQRRRVDVAAGHDAYDRPAAGLSGERRRHGRRARALRDDVIALDEQTDRVGDLAQRRHERSVEQLLREREHLREHARTADAVDERPRVRDIESLALGEGGDERRRRVGLGREDLRARAQRARGRGDPGCQTSTTERHDDRVDLRQILEDLEPDGAVAGHDRGVAEGVHEQAVDAVATMGAERVEPLVVRHRNDLASHALHGRELRGRSALRYHDGAGDAEAVRVPGDALRHVARARGPDTARELRARRERHGVARAADLEGADRLKALELEVDIGRRIGVQAHERRPYRGVGDAAARGSDVLERDHRRLVYFTRSSS